MPYAEFKKAGFEIDFVTEKGNMPECDRKMLEVRMFWIKASLILRELGLHAMVPE